MTWLKLDDGFYDHPKVLQAGNEAVGVFCRGLSYCGKQLTDGFIPKGIARSLGKPKAIAALMAAGLWEEIEGGYQVHDFLDFNPSAAEVKAKQKVRQEAGRLGGLASGKSRSK
jgi:hypothetical protein